MHRWWLDRYTLDEVREHFEANGVARQKWPEELHETDDFPRTASGKIQKQAVRQWVREWIAIPRNREYRSHK